MNNKKMFAFFGDDLEGLNSEILQCLHKEKYGMLALDTQAIGLASSNNIPFTVIDDWIDTEEMYLLKEQVLQCGKYWFASAREEFSVQGICWPEFDQEAMYWFWFEALIAGSLAEKFQKFGIKKLKFIQKDTLKPSVYYSKSDVSKIYWKSEIPEIAEPLLIHQSRLVKSPRISLVSMYDHIQTMLRKRMCKIKSSLNTHGRKENHFNEEIIDRNQYSILTDKIILAFNHAEFHRFTPIIEDLSYHFPNEIASVILSSNNNVARQIEEQWSIPVACAPSPIPKSRNYESRFLNAYMYAQKMSSGQTWEKILQNLQFHFEYYCKDRWPKLIDSFQAWVELWQGYSPRAVIISSLEDSESQLPAETAKLCGINTISIPHGGGKTRNICNQSAEFVLCPPLLKEIYERTHVPVGHLITCRNLLADSEYPAISTNVISDRGKRNVLALTNPTSMNISSYINPRAQMEALKILGNIPGDMRERLSLKIKVHPGFPDLELFSAVDDSLAQYVLPIKADLNQILNETDLVIAVNYCGAAIVNSVKAGKGIVFLITDPNIGRAEPYKFADLYFAAGIVVTTYDEFWRKIRHFLDDRSFAERMQEIAREICSRYVNDSNYPGVGEVVSKILTDNRSMELINQ